MGSSKHYLPVNEQEQETKRQEAHDVNVEYVEVVQQKRSKVGPVLNTIFVLLAIAAVGYVEWMRGQDRLTITFLEVQLRETQRYQDYAQQFITLDNEYDQIFTEYVNKCFRTEGWAVSVCEKLEYKKERYEREFAKINKQYKDGGWVKVTNR